MNFPFLLGSHCDCSRFSKQYQGHTHYRNHWSSDIIVTAIDVPSTLSGTDEVLVLDGQYAGMVSVTIVDAQGRVVPSSSRNITFSIASGPGCILDLFCHEPNKATSWRSAYHGLDHVVIQVTENSASSSHERRRLRQTDREGGIRTTIVHPEDVSPRAKAIVVKAFAEGLEGSIVSIPVSTDLERNNALAVAKRSITGTE